MSRLIPDDLKEQMIRNHYDATQRDIEDHPPVIHLFAGNANWLLSEVDPFYEDIAFGLCDLGVGEPELGNVSITELEEAMHETKGEPLVQRNEGFVPSYPMSVYHRAARMCRQITIDKHDLAVAQLTLIHKPK